MTKINWNGSDGFRFFLGSLPAEAFQEQKAYELIRIESSTNIQRGKVVLDNRYGRKMIDESEILEEAIKTSPANARRILRRF